MMEDEVVRRRGWMSHEEFLDLLGATHLIPGPNSTELAIHIGWARARWAGLLVAGFCFIAPAIVIVWGLAWAYVRFGSRPAVEGMLSGVQPVVIAVIAHALWGFARAALRSAMSLALFTAALVALALGTHELLVLGVAAGIALIDRRATAGGDPTSGTTMPVAIGLATSSSAAATRLVVAGGVAGSVAGGVAGGVALGPLALVFLKAGALLFGSGYVLFAFLQADLVDRLGWLTQSQLADAIAVGQMTPGPVFTSATFIGFVLAGHPGALVATGAIFLPAFLFVALSAPFLARWRTQPDLRAALDGVNAASLAMLATVSVTLARAAFVGDTPTIVATMSSLALFAISLWLLAGRRVNASWLMLAGAVAGTLLQVSGVIRP
jgi:chromate transporter